MYNNPQFWTYLGEKMCNSSLWTWPGQSSSFRTPTAQTHTSCWSKQEAVPFTFFNSTHAHQLSNSNQQSFQGNTAQTIIIRILRLTATMMWNMRRKKFHKGAFSGGWWKYCDMLPKYQGLQYLKIRVQDFRNYSSRLPKLTEWQISKYLFFVFVTFAY